MYRKLKNLILNSIKRSVIAEASSDDQGSRAIQKISYRGALGKSEMIFGYGHHANVPPDALCVTFIVAGDPENRATIPMSGKERVKGLTENEVIFFHPVTKSFIHFRSNGDIDIHGTKNINWIVDGDFNLTVAGDLNYNITGDFNITAPLTKVNGNFEVTGITTLGATVTSNGKDISDTHKHSGVTTGTGETGAPV